MNHSTHRLQAALAATLAALLAAAAGNAWCQQRYWYDGERKRPLWSEPATVADFSAPAGAKSQVLKPSALAGEGKRTSPVFRDDASEKSARRALPGGVLLRFRPGTTRESRQALLERHGLRALREIGAGTGTWLVDAEPGIASLELANRLYESGDFAAASPNWWRPRALK